MEEKIGQASILVFIMVVIIAIIKGILWTFATQNVGLLVAGLVLLMFKPTRTILIWAILIVGALYVTTSVMGWLVS